MENEDLLLLAMAGDCKYEGSKVVYRFSCNRNWKAVQDGVYEDIEKAVKFLPDQYKRVAANWCFWELNE